MATKAFVLGNNIDTDQLALGRYMAAGIEKLAAHCLEATYPGFSHLSSPGDVIIAGYNFGVGSSREQAVEVLKFLKISAVIAVSFAGIFYRNAINLGLPAIICKDVSSIQDGDFVELFIPKNKLNVPGKNLSLDLEPIPPNLVEILNSGGLIPYLKNRLNPNNSEI